MLEEHNIQNSVLEKIRAGRVSMRSRLFFVLQTIFVSIVAFVIFSIALFILSSVFFVTQESGSHFLLELGNDGIGAFLLMFPWEFFFTAIGLILVLELFIRHYTPAYRFSLLRIFIVLALIHIAGSAFIQFTPLHPALLSASDNDQLPLLKPLYQSVHNSLVPQGVFRGSIATITDSTILVRPDRDDRPRHMGPRMMLRATTTPLPQPVDDDDSVSWTIEPPQDFDTKSLQAGEHIFVAGRIRDDGTIKAYGIRHMPKMKRNTSEIK